MQGADHLLLPSRASTAPCRKAFFQDVESTQEDGSGSSFPSRVRAMCSKPAWPGVDQPRLVEMATQEAI